MDKPPPLSAAKQRVSPRRAAAWTLATIAVPLVLTFLFTSMLISGWYVVTRHEGAAPNAVIIRATFFGTPIGLWASVFLWWAFNRRAMTFPEMFKLRPVLRTPDIAAGLALAAAWIALYHFGGVVPFQEMIRLDTAKLQSLPLSISAGFCEEFLYRGFLLVILARAGAGVPLRVVVSAVAFGLGHLLWGPGGMFWTAILGLTFAALVVWRGNVWPAVVAHTVLNLFIEPALFEQAFAEAG